ncbi:hypothetical protein H4Q26_016192 [Puccinia striiformis f. sp. tritici PST-130]|nr:hypothetical protein H4Q26_016192 [Puccinia striiformis f. sp. tritici PST-130]
MTVSMGRTLRVQEDQANLLDDFPSVLGYSQIFIWEIETFNPKIVLPLSGGCKSPPTNP